MSIFRRYEWHYRGHDFRFEKKWPESWLEHLENCDHSITDPAEYDHYISNDPYEDELSEFLEELLDMGSRYVEFNENIDILEYLLSFVQHLRYLEERGEYPRYPMETVIDRGGDCEDTAILMAFILQGLDYDCAFLDFEKEGFLGFGGYGHIDLGIAPSFSNEFSGTYWEKDGTKYYYIHCNGRNRQIGEYSGKWGNRATIHPV